MKFLWNGDLDRPEDALDYSNLTLRRTNRDYRRLPIVIGNPIASYDGPEMSPFFHWFEVHNEHDTQNIEKTYWANATILKPVGLLCGFETEIASKMIYASRMPTLPEGAKGFSILFINGPNLNLLGTREPEIYGKKTLKNIFEEMGLRHPDLEAQAIQSNSERDIINAIQNARNKFDAIVINAGAFTHSSIAIHDALKNFDDIIIELHISNPHQREAFRHKSYISPAVHGVVAGFGTNGYELAIMGVMSKL